MSKSPKSFDFSEIFEGRTNHKIEQEDDSESVTSKDGGDDTWEDVESNNNSDDELQFQMDDLPNTTSIANKKIKPIAPPSATLKTERH